MDSHTLPACTLVDAFAVKMRMSLPRKGHAFGSFGGVPHAALTKFTLRRKQAERWLRRIKRRHLAVLATKDKGILHRRRSATRQQWKTSWEIPHRSGGSPMAATESSRRGGDSGEDVAGDGIEPDDDRLPPQSVDARPI